MANQETIVYVMGKALPKMDASDLWEMRVTGEYCVGEGTREAYERIGGYVALELDMVAEEWLLDADAYALIGRLVVEYLDARSAAIAAAATSTECEPCGMCIGA